MTGGELNAFILGILYGVPLGAIVYASVRLAVRRQLRHRGR